MGKVNVTVHELSPVPMMVSADGNAVTLQPGQSRDFSGTSITVRDTRAADDPGPTILGDGDVWNHGNPNGVAVAEIGPKMPKAGGETYQEVVDGRILERTIPVDPALAIAEGGPDGAEEGKTPGPDIDRSAASSAGAGAGANPTGAESSPAGTKTHTLEDILKGKNTPAKPATSGASPKK